jgi:septal ring-binding cell division protein DamX
VAKNLSQYRVNAVKDYLLSKKVNPAQLTTPQGMGYQSPLVRNPVSKDEHRMNNRITYTVSRIDSNKELEYSRLNVADQPAQTVAQTNTQATTSTKQQTTTTSSQTAVTPSQAQQVTQQQTTQSQSQSSKSYTALSDGQFVAQIASGGTLDLKQPDFVKITTKLGLEVKYKLVDGKYKYFVGFFSTITEAKDAIKDLETIGIKGAWPRGKY